MCRLLEGERLYFKQAGRMPPVYQARTQEAIAQLQRQAEAERREAHALAAFVGAVRVHRA